MLLNNKFYHLNNLNILLKLKKFIDLFFLNINFLMSVVPKSAKDFSDPEYWKKFFEKRKTAFEWFDFTIFYI